MTKSDKSLLWIAGIFIVILVGVYSYKKYLEMRMAGADVGEAAMLMLFAFFVILGIIAIIVLFTWRYVIPKSIEIYHGFKRVKNKEKSVAARELHVEEIKNIARKKEDDLIRQQEEMMDLVMLYTQESFKKILSDEQLTILKSNIIKLKNGSENYAPVESRQTEFVTPLDLYHFGWNIGKRLVGKDKSRKFGIETASFVKESFPVTLANHSLNTITTKLSSNDGVYSLRKINPDEVLIPHVFPGT